MKKNSISVQLVSRLTGHRSGIYALESKKDTDIFWTGSGDQVVAQWNAEETSDGVMIAKSTGIIYSLRYIPENDHLLIGQSNGGVHVINLKTNAEERLLQYHSAPVFYIAYLKKYELVFTLAGDGTLSVLSSKDYHLIKTLKIAEGKLRCFAFHPVKDEATITCADGSILILSIPDIEIIYRFQAHTKDFSVNTVAYADDGKFLLSGSRDAHLNIFSTDDYSLIQSIPAHNYAIYDIAFHSSKKIFATASRDKTIKLWDAKTFEVIAKLDKEHNDGHTHSVNKLLWMDNFLISTGDDRSIIVWKLKTTTNTN